MSHATAESMSAHTTRSPRLALATLLLLGLSVTPLSAQDFGGFTWTLMGDTLTATAFQDASSMQFVGPDNGCDDTEIWFETLAPVPGTVTVKLDWSIIDLCHFDWPIYVVDGVSQKIPTSGDSLGCFGNNPDVQVSFDVGPGSTFGLGVGSADCAEGPGIAVFTDITFTPGAGSVQSWIDEGSALDARLIETYAAPFSFSGYGSAVALPGDLDGDDVPDIVVGTGSLSRTEAFSGATGAMLWESIEAVAFGESVLCIPDVDGDQVTDLIVGDSILERVHLVSGVSGALLWTWIAPSQASYARGLAVLDDLNGDGIAEVAVGGDFQLLPDAKVHLLSGLDGSLFDTLDAPPQSAAFGRALANAGDVDGDGTGDILVGVPSPPAHARVYSGANRSELFRLSNPNANQFPDLGLAVAAAGDVNNDGHADLLVSAPSADNDDATDNTGAVLLYNGADGAFAQVTFGSVEGQHLGRRLLGGLDINGDGSLEMAVSDLLPSSSGLFGGVSLRRIIGGHELARFEARGPSDTFGDALATYDTGGVTTHLAVSAPDGEPGGEVTYWQSLTHPAVAHLTGSGNAVPGLPWSVTLETGLPFASTGIVIGLQALELPFKGGVLVPSPDKILFLTLDSEGRFSTGGIWPASVPATIPVWLQAWIVDPAGPAGFSASNALRTTQL